MGWFFVFVLMCNYKLIVSRIGVPLSSLVFGRLRQGYKHQASLGYVQQDYQTKIKLFLSSFINHKMFSLDINDNRKMRTMPSVQLA